LASADVAGLHITEAYFNAGPTKVKFNINKQ